MILPVARIAVPKNGIPNKVNHDEVETLQKYKPKGSNTTKNIFHII